MTAEDFVRIYLLYVILPLWLLSGIADWACHRATHIEATSGPKESLLHLTMLGEGAVAILLGLFFEINGLVLAIMFAAWIAHEITSHWDLAYAYGRRDVRPIEQHIHAYLGVLPFLALSLVFVLHWTQVLAWFGLGPEPLRLTLEWKRTPLPLGYIFGLLGAIVLIEVLPYGEELIRTLRQRLPGGVRRREDARLRIADR